MAKRRHQGKTRQAMVLLDARCRRSATMRISTRELR